MTLAIPSISFGRAALIAGLVLALCGASAAAGYFYRGGLAEVQTSAIHVAGTAQTVAAKAETARRTEINQEITDGYQDARQRLLARPVLPALSAAPRLRIAACDHAGDDRTDSGAIAMADGNAVERGAGAERGPASEPAWEGFARSCAADAQQVMWLQDYVERVCLHRQVPVGEE